jgi:hypothetical protein
MYGTKAQPKEDDQEWTPAPAPGPVDPDVDIAGQALENSLKSADPGNAFFDTEGGETQGPSPFDDPEKGAPYDASGAETPNPEKKTGGYFDPTSDDPRMQKYRQRIDDINEQLEKRRSGLGGIIQSFGSSGDHVARQLLAEKQSLVNEMHGEAQLAGQYSKAQMQQEGQLQRAQTAANARYYTADQGLAGRQYTADTALKVAQQKGLTANEVAQIRAGSGERIAQIHGLTARDVATIRGDYATDINDATNASHEAIAGQNNETKTNIYNAGAQQKQAQATAPELLAHAKMLAAIGDTDGAKQFSQIAGQVLQAQMKTPAPQAKTPGAAPQGGPPAVTKGGLPVPDGTPDGSGKYVAKGGVWVPADQAAPAPLPMQASHG